MTDLKKLGQMQIGGRDRYPSKTTINLYYREENLGRNILSVALFLLVMTLAFLFSHYYIVPELRSADLAEQRYAETEQLLNRIKEENSVYGQVRAEYSHYGNGYLNEEERALQDRITILNVLDERIHTEGGIQSISVSGNAASVRLQVVNADRLPPIIQSLEESEYVLYVTASTASTKETASGSYGRLVTGDTDSAAADAYVNVALTVYFRSPAEVQAARESGSGSGDAHLDAGDYAVGSNAYVPEISPTAAADATAAGSSGSGNTSSGTAGNTSIGSSTGGSTAAGNTTAGTGTGSSGSGSQGSVNQGTGNQGSGSSGTAGQTQGQSSAGQSAGTAAVQGQAANIQTPESSAAITDLQGGDHPF